MLPIRDANPTRRTPYVTVGIIAANIIVFLTEPIRRPVIEQARFFICKAAIPVEVTHWRQISEFAAACPHKSIWGSILYSMFLHGGWLHIGFNMLFLWVFGNNVEDTLGRVRYVGFYLACGLAATFAQSYISPASRVPLVGASGAIAGVLGAYLVLFPRARVTNLVILFFFITVIELPASVVLGLWFVLQIFSGVGSVRGATGGVAYFAHIGGFLAGMLLVVLLRPRAPDRRPQLEL